MGVLELLERIKAEERLEVITEWCGIPVKTKLTVKWVAVKDKVICLDIRDCKFRHIFRMSSEPIYIKIEKPRQAYIQCDLYNREYRDELILLVEHETPPPPVIARSYVRVVPSESKPVYVSLSIGGEEITAKVADISEKGVGVLLSKESVEKLIQLGMHGDNSPNITFTLSINLPDGNKVPATGELRNIFTDQEQVRMGFRLDIARPNDEILKRYIMDRQRELLSTLLTGL
jgi:c-di-GMP-binding flagellar brake protein YcgR